MSETETSSVGMKVTTAAQLASPVMLKMGDRELFFSPLSIDDMGILEQNAKVAGEKVTDERIGQLKKYGIGTPENIKEVLTKHFADADSGKIESKYMNSFEGTAHSLYLSIIHRHNDVTVDFVRKNTSLLDLPFWQSKLDDLTYPTVAGATNAADAERKADATVDSDSKLPNAEAPVMPGQTTQAPEKTNDNEPKVPPAQSTSVG